MLAPDANAKEMRLVRGACPGVYARPEVVQTRENFGSPMYQLLDMVSYHLERPKSEKGMNIGRSPMSCYSTMVPMLATY